MAPSFPFVDGFEHGLANWTTTGMTIESVVVADGVGAARAIGAGSAQSPGTPVYADRSIGAPTGDIWISASINLIAAPSGPLSLVSALSMDNQPVAAIVLNESRELVLVNSIAGSTANLGSIDLAQWRRIELHVRLTGGGPVAEAWVDGIFKASIALTTTVLGITAVRIGDASGTATYDVAYDNVAASTSCTANCPPEPADATTLPTETPTPSESTPAPTETATPEPAPTETSTPVIEPKPPTQTPTAETPPEGSPVAEPIA
jgi:hypothetical protein